MEGGFFSPKLGQQNSSLGVTPTGWSQTPPIKARGSSLFICRQTCNLHSSFEDAQNAKFPGRIQFVLKAKIRLSSTLP